MKRVGRRTAFADPLHLLDLIRVIRVRFENLDMRHPEFDAVDALKREWTDKLVRVKPEVRADLTRFAGRVGRIVTVNYGGRAVVDFADGGWYDIADFAAVLEPVTDDAESKKYDATANSAQPFPARQS